MINIIGILLLYFGPLYIINFNNDYTFYAEIFTISVYMILLTFSIMYLIGAIRCSVDTAFEVMCEYIANKSIQNYLHLAIVSILSVFMYYTDYFYLIDYSLLSLLMFTPIFIHVLSRTVINKKAKTLYEINS